MESRHNSEGEVNAATRTVICRSTHSSASSGWFAVIVRRLEGERELNTVPELNRGVRWTDGLLVVGAFLASGSLAQGLGAPPCPDAAREKLLEVREWWAAYVHRLYYLAIALDHQWEHVGRVTIVGDAAHLTSLFVGEGTNLVIVVCRRVRARGSAG